MSLNWELKHVAGYNEVCFYTAKLDEPGRGIKKGDRALRPATEALLMVTMVIGIGRWTKDNIDEVFSRIRHYERVTRPLLCVPDDLSKPIEMGILLPDTMDGKYISYTEIVRHIGLITNVFPQTTKVQWAKQIDNLSRREREYEIRHAKMKREEG